jgi:hypothetical protein
MTLLNQSLDFRREAKTTQEKTGIKTGIQFFSGFGRSQRLGSNQEKIQIIRLRTWAKWHVRVIKQSCKQGNRLILWGV